MYAVVDHLDCSIGELLLLKVGQTPRLDRLARTALLSDSLLLFRPLRVVAKPGLLEDGGLRLAFFVILDGID
jgi:hypothetical protein